MERRIDISNIDLDVVAQALEERLVTWAELGITAHPVTWTDMEGAWNQPLTTDRAAVIRPRSIGVRLQVGDRDLEAVLYAGGWADIGFMAPGSGEAVFRNVPEVDAPDEFVAALDGAVSEFWAMGELHRHRPSRLSSIVAGTVFTVVVLLVGGLTSQVSGWLTAFVFLWLFLFVLGLWADEDANHWDWPGDNGPGALVTLRIAAITTLVAGVPCLLGWWFLSR